MLTRLSCVTDACSGPGVEHLVALLIGVAASHQHRHAEHDEQHADDGRGSHHGSLRGAGGEASIRDPSRYNPRAVTSSIAPGTRLGPYEIVASIGAGGMGQVYRALDTRLDRTVALKILPAEYRRRSRAQATLRSRSAHHCGAEPPAHLRPARHWRAEWHRLHRDGVPRRRDAGLERSREDRCRSKRCSGTRFRSPTRSIARTATA